jgi:hypothetical protein
VPARDVPVPVLGGEDKVDGCPRERFNFESPP